MIVRLWLTRPRPQVLRGKYWIAAWGAASWQVEDASTESAAEADTVKAWKSIDQLS